MARWIVLAFTPLVVGCGPGSLCDGFGVECASDAVGEAMSTVESVETWSLMQGNGDGLAARVDLLQRGLVPGVGALLDRGDDAAPLLAERFEQGGGYEIDHALVAYAWVLGELRHEASLETLADFVEVTGYGSDLALAPHAATDAIHQILGDEEPRRSTLLDYDLPARDAAVAAARAGSTTQPQVSGPPSCQTRFTMADADGNPITYERNGQTVEATFECVRFANTTVPASYAAEAVQRVTAGGGEYVSGPLGQPNRAYNCAGYSFRELTTVDGLNCSAPHLLDILTAAGLLTEKSLSSAVAGDKIFFFSPRTIFNWWPSTSPPHVAVVQSVAGEEIVVRAPDNQTGVFDAPLSAAYFGAWTPVAYEWTGGVVPRVITSIDADVDARYCSDECGGGCGDDEICLDGACVPKTEQTSCELRVPQCCPGQDNSCTAPDAACYCDAYCVTAGDCCADACSVCGYCG